jgi:subtilase family serine protease
VRIRPFLLSAAVGVTAVLGSAVPAGAAGPGLNLGLRILPAGCSLGINLHKGFSHCNAGLLSNWNGSPHATSGPSGFGPADLQTAYKLTTASASAGATQTVAIVDAYDDPNAEADMGVYRSTFGLGACTTANGCFSKVNGAGVKGSYPASNAGWATEISLDLDMVSAICPKCHILLVEGTSNANADLYAAEDTAARLAPNAISNSWGGAEGSSDAAANTHFNHPGIAVTASSGDSGYGVQFPAASPYVTSVGGTTLTRDSSTRGWSETAWSGSGSGCSKSENKPAWQTDTAGCARRTVADVSAVADPKTGVAVYDTFVASNCFIVCLGGGGGGGGWMVVGGTSAGTPLIAAVYALAGNAGSTSYPASIAYAHATSLYDITSGSNAKGGGGLLGLGGSSKCSNYLCTAGPGYDGPPGLGTPNGVAAF